MAGQDGTLGRSLRLCNACVCRATASAAQLTVLYVATFFAFIRLVTAGSQGAEQWCRRKDWWMGEGQTRGLYSNRFGSRGAPACSAHGPDGAGGLHSVSPTACPVSVHAAPKQVICSC